MRNVDLNKFQALAPKFPSEALAFAKATVAAKKAAEAAHARIGERDACGFAWVEIHPGNSRIARFVKELGVGSKGHAGGYTVWDPSGHPTQSVSVLEAGAKAFAQVLQVELGQRDIRACSRLD